MRAGRSVFREYLEALLIAVIFATFARTYVVQAFKIPTGSMEQNLLIGDHILVNKFIYSPLVSPIENWLFPSRSVRRGDIVVFKFPTDPSRDFIKRCIALGGDQVEIIDKQLLVNGEPVGERGYTYFADPHTYPRSVFLPDDYRYRDNFGPFEVPEGELFFLGDNRDNSNDSRFWGTVPRRLIKGRAFLVYWSFRVGGTHPESANVLGRVRQLAYVAAHFATNTRWARSFRVVR